MSYTNGLDKPSNYFTTKLFTGNGGTNAITGVGFQPDWIWFKNRTSAQSHAIVDSVRGRKGLQSNATDAEYTLNSGKDFGTFDSDGFTVLTPEQLNSFNYNTGSIVSWNWKAGTSFTNDASATGIGSIDSAGSVNNDAGFSIVSWTGTGSNGTIKHGLSTVPKIMIVKERDNANNWFVYHYSLGATKQLILQETDAEASFTATWNDTEPTSSVFSVGTSNGTNRSGGGLIAYCFADTGNKFFKAGSYTGNGSSSGPFCFTGFKPAFVLGKRTDSAGGWWISDNKRSSGFNLNDEYLLANDSQAEADDGSFASDFLSNGWKARATNGNFNASGGSYIFAAFSENPFVTSTGVPATAR